MHRRRHQKKKPRLTNHGRLHHNNPDLPCPPETNGFFQTQSLPTAICDFYKNGVITFTGDCRVLLEKIKKLSQQQILTVKRLNLALLSQLTQNQDNCCLVTMFLAGVVCVIPWFIVNRSWFRRRYRELYETKVEQYEGMRQVVQRLPALELLQLALQDNYMDQGKVRVLEEVVRGCAGRSVVRNLAAGVDLVGNQQQMVVNCFKRLQGTYSFSFSWDKISLNSQPSASSSSPTCQTQSQTLFPVY